MSFSSKQYGYQQHMNSSTGRSSAHARTTHDTRPYCEPCKRVFVHTQAYTEHLMRSQRHIGRSVKCPFCKRGFGTASNILNHLESGSCSSGLNHQLINEAIRRLDSNNIIIKPKADLTSPSHAPAVYRCPKKSCGSRFRFLSSLVNHCESESCGAMSFGQIQQSTKGGIENMAGRKIR